MGGWVGGRVGGRAAEVAAGVAADVAVWHMPLEAIAAAACACEKKRNVACSRVTHSQPLA